MLMRSARWRPVMLAIAFVAMVGCHRQQQPDEDDDSFVPLPPVPVHVKNENFADVNINAIIGGVSRRLGTVTGNSVGDFVINYGLSPGQPIILTAIAIGGAGGVSSGSLLVAPGQMIDFRIGSVIRQSSASVRDP